MLQNELPRFEILSPESMATLDRGWRRIVSEIGVEFLSEEAHELFRQAGQRVEENIVYFDPEFLLEQLKLVPEQFEIQARNPANNVTIGGKNMVFSSVYGAPFVRDGDVRRDGTLGDFQNFCRLAQSFAAMDSVGGVVVEPNDASLDSRHLDMVFNAFTLTDKFIMGNVVTGENAADTIAMAEIVLGGRKSIEEKPFGYSLINCNSPLRWDDRMLDSLFVYCKAKQPVIVTPFLLMGAMSPVSIAATLAQQVAEAFSGIALTQLIRPGTPVIMGSFLSNIDMKTGSPQFGTPESAVGQYCIGQIARAYKVPFRAGGGLNASQLPDAQAAYESVMTLMPTFLAGANVVLHSAGWLEGGLVSCFEKYIIDIQILEQLIAEFQPIEFTDDDLAFDAHDEVRHGGHFLGAAHTMENFRDCFYRPWLSSSDNFERWTRNGSIDTAGRARAIYLETLDKYEEPPMDEAIKAELVEYVVKRRVELDG